MQVHAQRMTDVISEQTRALLIASFMRGIGKATLWSIASDPLFYRIEPQHLGDVHPALADFGTKGDRFQKAKSRAESEVEKAQALGVRIIGYSDSEYPVSMRRAPSAPALFWYKGDTAALQMPNVAVIGTRQPTRAGKIMAERIASAICESGFCVASGLALGVDSIAHQAAVALRRPTVAILAGGLDSIHPKRNAALAEDIVLHGGGLLSEFAIGAPSMPTNFVVRDSTQAAIAACVVLVQSDTVGGSLHASRACVKLGRKLYVVRPIANDLASLERKVQANVELLAGRHQAMNFPADSSAHIVPLSSREDYPAFFESVRSTWASFDSRRFRREHPGSASPD